MRVKIKDELKQAITEAAALKKLAGYSFWRDQAEFTRVNRAPKDMICRWCMRVVKQKSPTRPKEYCSPKHRRLMRNKLRRERNAEKRMAAGGAHAPLRPSDR